MAVVADVLVEKVLDVMLSTIVEEVRRVVGVEEEVEKLTLSLQSIRAVLADAERRQWEEPTTVQLWLNRLKSVALDIDDVVDEWSYKILKSKTERDQNAHEPRRKVWRFSFRSSCYCFPWVVLRHHMAIKISDLNARLDVIATEKDRYNFQLVGRDIERNIKHNITTSIIDISKVRGRDVDKQNLVNMLLSSNREQNELRIISVVGMGGIGKTTLAQLVYNDERVVCRFHKRIWVCVSDPFDETKIAKDILESLLGFKPELDALPNILKRIQELVGGEECLFVFDDVWNEDRGKWEQLQDCLKGSASKSSILVTTRKEGVGRIMGCSKSDIVRIVELPRDESWELFCMIAFFGRSSRERASLEKIGREVVERCKGLPLAIKAIASLLQLKEGLREWQNVLDSKLWNWEGFQRDIAPALWLSYYDLPSHLKQCFLYCAIFPKDYKMHKDELVKHWIAQGYVKAHAQDIVMISEEYFENLVMRSFFQEVEVDYITIITCKMHDIVHDFAQLLVSKGCVSIEVNDVNDKISFSSDSLAHSARHLSISFQTKVKCVDSFYNLKKLRSLVVSSPKWWLTEELFLGLDLQKLFNVMTLLRSLQLRTCGIEEIPSNINRLVHLRELDLSDNKKLKDLPDTIWELYNLQIFSLRKTGIRYVKGIGRLVNLSYLDINNTNCSLPKDTVRLSGLRRLIGVNINVNNDDLLSLKHLKNFNQLGGLLVIRWLQRGDGDVEDAKQAQLIEKKCITKLGLCFGSKEEEEEEEKEEGERRKVQDGELAEDEERRGKQDEELGEAINAPPYLEFLFIKDYMGSRAPKWLYSLTVVKIVGLDSWRNCEHLPFLGKLPCLEYLGLRQFNRVAKVGGEFLGMDEMKSAIVPFFPNLKSLEFRDFDNWEEWNDVDADRDEEMSIMPSLTSLIIYKCKKLKAMPSFILKKTSLKLDIALCDALERSTSRERVQTITSFNCGVHMEDGDPIIAMRISDDN